MTRETCCAACVTRATIIRPPRELASATRRFSPRSMNSNGICTSTFTWKITCSFRVPSRWSRANRAARPVRNRKRNIANAGANLRTYSRTGTPAVPHAGVLCRDRADFHAASRNVPWGLELDEHQQPSRGGNRSCWLDPGPRSGADLRLDRHIDSWDWLLLHPQAAAHEAFRAARAVDFLDLVDLGRGAALDHGCLPVALAMVISRICGP